MTAQASAIKPPPSPAPPRHDELRETLQRLRRRNIELRGEVKRNEMLIRTAELVLFPPRLVAKMLER